MASARAWQSRARSLAADWVSSSPRLFSVSASLMPVAEVAEHFQCLLVAGGGGRVVPGQPLHDAQLVAVVASLIRSPRPRDSSIARARLAAAAG